MQPAELEQWKAREVARLLALVESERRYYQDILASLPVGLLILSADFAVVSANRAVKQIFGLRGSESFRGQVDSLLPASVLDRVEEVLRTNTPQNGIIVETPLNGGRSLRLGIQAIHNWDGASEAEALITVEDITDLRHCSPAPAVSKEPSESAIDNLPATELVTKLDAAVWAVEVPGMKFLWTNEECQRLFGTERADWLNAPERWLERIHPAHRESVQNLYQAAIDNPAQYDNRVNIEYRGIRPDGKSVWVYERANIILDEHGHPRYLVGMSLDFGERRMLEDQVVQGQRVDAAERLAGR